ncbi:glycosyltransferase family 1 protein [Microbulbifer agarilyticus]|uniref:glycosyltransferase family 1 protein n=1 Tax=Microbulbifer agarilyticus TaxID=260552 RepID=UPI001C97C574|nr:glycosyltransferase family 1 protein [Microbulbifer agarilyticus]MBY6190516.1 glycosyltransferase family 1 protein [Microbulbifer agarilyticus]
MSSRYIVVEEVANPSSDYFVLPYLQAQGATVERYRFSELPDPARLHGANVLFVRYIPAVWRELIATHHNRLAGVWLFMDDDLFSWRSFAGMPLRYQWKLWRLSRRHRSWLRAIDAKLAVSTPYLQARYASWNPHLLTPEVPAALTPLLKRGDSPVEKSEQVTLFYHGSASHGADIKWLQPVIAEVLSADKRIVFEVIGNGSVNRLFRGLPRVHVLHPMKWPAYQSLLHRPGRTIGLAPLLDSRFNRARAHTKFLDITLAGAVGIYAEGEVYGKVVCHQKNGLLLPMDQNRWVESILQLAADEPTRAQMLGEARQCL